MVSTQPENQMMVGIGWVTGGHRAAISDQTLPQHHGRSWSDGPQLPQVPHCHLFQEMSVTHLWVLLELLHSARLASVQANAWSTEQNQRSSSHLQQDWKSVPCSWSSTLHRTSSRFCCAEFVNKFALTGWTTLVQPRPTQSKCACCSPKTKHIYCKCKLAVHGGCFIIFHTKWNIFWTRHFNWIPKLASEICHLPVLLVPIANTLTSGQCVSFCYFANVCDL